MTKSFVSLIFLISLSSYAQHEIDLAFQNSQCKNDKSCTLTGAPSALANCLCTTQVYRASCPDVNSCPDPNSNLSAFKLLPNTSTTLTATIDSTGTYWKYYDTDAALTAGSTWTYAISNSWADQSVATPSSGFNNSGGWMIPVPKAHVAILNYTSTSCTSTNSCWIQIYRAVCPNSTCPTYTPGSPAWVSLINSSTLTFPVWTTSTTGTVWQAQDADAALVANTMYVYVATLCYQPSCSAYSTASAPWSGSTSLTKKRGKK